MRAEKCLNIGDLERCARQRLPQPLFDYIQGGSDDEITLAANVTGFDRYALLPRYLRDVRDVDSSVAVLGSRLAWPLYLAPTGMTQMFHRDGEMAVARAAARSGVGYALSTMGTTSIEDIGAVPDLPKMFQMYLLNDDSLNRAMVDRCRAAAFDALCITVDCITAGNRERDIRSGLSVPPRLNLQSLGQFARRPEWCLNYLRGGAFRLPNIGDGNGGGDISTLASYFAQKMESNISWQHVEAIARQWQGPLAIKGLQSAQDATMAVEAGATAVIVSNHGGRQLDGSAASIDLLPAIADAIGGKAEIILDGGIRRGSHMVKALALGATACMTGRPYLYGLSAFGAAGVDRSLAILHSEFVRTMALVGCRSVADLKAGTAMQGGAGARCNGGFHTPKHQPAPANSFVTVLGRRPVQSLNARENVPLSENPSR